jgi:hypothetical protein
VATVHTVQTVTASLSEWGELQSRYGAVNAEDVAGHATDYNLVLRRVTLDLTYEVPIEAT